MRYRLHLMVLLASVVTLTVAARPAQAQRADSAAYVVRFGTDTLAMERWIRTADGLEAVSVSRSPETVVRRYAVRLGTAGTVTHRIVDGTATPIEPAGAIPTAGGFYAPQALALAQAAAARDTIAGVTMLAGANVQQLRVRRIGPDAFELLNPAGAVTLRARLTNDGRLLFAEAGPNTTIERVAWFDIDAWAAEFRARDERGQGMGPLSTQDTARISVAGATLMVDYGRPAARGRTVFGGVVPFGAVWRTGANDATQLTVDRTVRIGDVVVEPGTYSLFTVPGRDSWQIGINRGTDMAAAMSPDAELTLGTATMTVRPLPGYVERFTILLDPASGGALLRLQWETTEAVIPVVVGGGE